MSSGVCFLSSRALQALRFPFLKAPVVSQGLDKSCCQQVWENAWSYAVVLNTMPLTLSVISDPRCASLANRYLSNS